jgi:hypothetical protein
MTVIYPFHEPSHPESNPIQDSGFFSEDSFDLEKLFEQHVLSSQEVVAVSKAAFKWKAYKKETSSRNSQMERLVCESKDLIKLSEKERATIKSFILRKDFAAVEKIFQSKWKSVLRVCLQLEDLGYYVFLHSAAFEQSLLLEMQTYLQEGRGDALVSSNWDRYRKFRENPEKTLKYENVQDYFSSELCEAINFSDSRVTDRWPNSKWLLACDGFLSNTDENESAYSFYKKNMNYSNVEMLFKQFFNQKFQDYWLSAAFGQKGIEKLQALARYSNLQDLVAGQGQVFLMGVLKSTLEEEATNYVYRSHPYGKRCACLDQTHKAFVDLLNQDQKGNSSKCLISDELELNPQYRMLIENFDKDPEKVVISLSSLTPSQQKLFKEEFFWPLAYALKQLAKLAAYEGAEEELVNILNKLPRGLSYWKRNSSLEMRLFLEKELQPLYLMALDQIINDKRELLQAALEKLPQELQSKLRVLLRRAENIEIETLDLLRKDPSLVQNLPHSSLQKILNQLTDQEFSLCTLLLQHLDKDAFYEIIQGSLGDKILSKGLEKDNTDLVAKMIASSPKTSWDFPDSLTLEDIYLKAIKLNDKVMAELPYPLELTKEFALKAVSQNYEALNYIDPAIENYKEIALKALEQSPDAYQYVEDSLQKDPEILKMRDTGSV